MGQRRAAATAVPQQDASCSICISWQPTDSPTLGAVAEKVLQGIGEGGLETGDTLQGGETERMAHQGGAIAGDDGHV